MLFSWVQLDRVFCGLIAAGSFAVLWRTANITPIPKGCSASHFLLDYRPISTTHHFQDLWKAHLQKALYIYIDCIKVLSNTPFGFRKGLGTTYVFLLLIHNLQFSFDKKDELKVHHQCLSILLGMGGFDLLYLKILI